MKNTAGPPLLGLAAALLLTACGSAELRRPIIVASPPPKPTLESPAAVDFEPDTAIREWLVVTGFPAVSTDGQLVAFDASDDDGARGYDNMTIVVRRVDDDTVVFEQQILSVDEQDELFELSPEIIRARFLSRVGVARDFLARHEWVSMTTALAYLGTEEEDFIMPGPSGPYGLAADPEALRVHFTEPTLTAQLGGALASWSRPEWSAPSVNHCDPDDPDTADDPTCVCDNPAHVRRGWVDIELRVLVVMVGYLGNDSCWEPDTVEHTARLPGGAR